MPRHIQSFTKGFYNFQGEVKPRPLSFPGSHSQETFFLKSMFDKVNNSAVWVELLETNPLC